MVARKIVHTQNSTKSFCTHTITNGKAAFVNWKQKGVVKEYSLKAVNPTETEGMHIGIHQRD